MKYFLLTILIIAFLDSLALIYFTVELLKPDWYVLTFLGFVSTFCACLLVFHIKELKTGSR
jgi:hypothetical protein